MTQASLRIVCLYYTIPVGETLTAYVRLDSKPVRQRAGPLWLKSMIPEWSAACSSQYLRSFCMRAGERTVSFPIFHPFRPFHFMHPQLLVCPESSLSSDTTTLFPQLHRHPHVCLKSPLVWSFASDGDRTVRRPYLFPIRFGGVP